MQHDPLDTRPAVDGAGQTGFAADAEGIAAWLHRRVGLPATRVQRRVRRRVGRPRRVRPPPVSPFRHARVGPPIAASAPHSVEDRRVGLSDSSRVCSTLASALAAASAWRLASGATLESTAALLVADARESALKCVTNTDHPAVEHPADVLKRGLLEFDQRRSYPPCSCAPA